MPSQLLAVICLTIGFAPPEDKENLPVEAAANPAVLDPATFKSDASRDALIKYQAEYAAIQEAANKRQREAVKVLRGELEAAIKLAAASDSFEEVARLAALLKSPALTLPVNGVPAAPPEDAATLLKAVRPTLPVVAAISGRTYRVTFRDGERQNWSFQQDGYLLRNGKPDGSRWAPITDDAVIVCGIENGSVDICKFAGAGQRCRITFVGLGKDSRMQHTAVRTD